MERIHSAGIRYFNGNAGEQSIVFGHERHAGVRASNAPVVNNAEEGYWTTHNRFVSRKTAAGIALHSGQAMKISNPALGLCGHDLVWGYPSCETSA